MARTIKSRRGAWFRVGSLFLLDLLFLGAGVFALRGDFQALAVVVAIGAALAIGFNVYLVWRMRTTEATWKPGSGAGVLRSSFEYLGIPPRFPVLAWEGLGAAAIVVNLVALVVA